MRWVPVYRKMAKDGHNHQQKQASYAPEIRRGKEEEKDVSLRHGADH